MNDKNRYLILVLSDSHGNAEALSEALKRPLVDAVIFLGDGLTEAEYFAEGDSSRAWFAVKGNGDFRDEFLGTPIKKTEALSLGGKKIVYTHGDKYGVKYGTQFLYNLAIDTGADIVLYGHTHFYDEEYRDGIYIFNPGTVGGMGGRPKTAGLLTIENDSVMFSKMEL